MSMKYFVTFCLPPISALYRGAAVQLHFEYWLKVSFFLSQVDYTPEAKSHTKKSYFCMKSVHLNMNVNHHIVQINYIKYIIDLQNINNSLKVKWNIILICKYKNY